MTDQPSHTTDPVLAIAGPTDTRTPLERAIEMMQRAIYQASVEWVEQIHGVDVEATLALAPEALLARQRAQQLPE